MGDRHVLYSCRHLQRLFQPEGASVAMTVYVDDVRHRFGRMVMCHMWADTMDELYAMVDRIGVARRWLQQPPKASWTHFDISLDKKARHRGGRRADRQVWTA
jgi:hypothetical protein